MAKIKRFDVAILRGEEMADKKKVVHWRHKDGSLLCDVDTGDSVPATTRLEFKVTCNHCKKILASKRTDTRD